MTDLVTFDYESAAVRIVQIDGAPWFVASDIAAILGFDHTPHLVRLLEDDETDTHIVRSRGNKGTHNVSTSGALDVHNVDTPGNNRRMTIISESGLYNAIFKSRRPEARAFRRWVTGTVLPAIRATGCFALIDAPVAPSPAAMLDPLALSAVSLMRKLRGNAYALALWQHLGLPLPEMVAGDDAGDDDLALRVAQWAGHQDRFTNDELAAGLGLPSPDAMMRRRLGDCLRALGFEKRHGRRPGLSGVHHLWFRGAVA